MIVSLLVKVVMVALTMGVIFWIGWAVPQPESDSVLALSKEVAPALHAEGPADAGPIPGPIGQTAESMKRSSVPKVAGKVDLNRATEKDLELLPGIGAVLAGRIVKYRQDVGSFSRVEDLRDVKGIGKKKFDKIKNLVQVTVRKPEGDGKISA
ncbi:MAG: helix-hairpin-helix domain-containing protein [Nitrospira sp.]|nr:helix-hairpin-helix domain-containing protein [Nitrospira sp.]